jgi:ribonuclease D
MNFAQAAAQVRKQQDARLLQEAPESTLTQVMSLSNALHPEDKLEAAMHMLRAVVRHTSSDVGARTKIEAIVKTLDRIAQNGL